MPVPSRRYLSHRQTSLWVRIFPAFGWAAALVGHAAIAMGWIPTYFLRAVVDVTAHGLFAALLLLPFLRSRTTRPVAWFAWSVAVLIDIDHAAAAGSVYLIDMMTLAARPLTHSLLFGLVLVPVFALGARFLRPACSSLLAGYLVFLSVASHVLRDATYGKTPWLWPFSSPGIPDVFFLSGCILVFVIHAYSTRKMTTNRTRIPFWNV